MGLFRRGGIWYGRVKLAPGIWQKRTLNTADRKVALARYRDLERETIDPAHRAAHETTLAGAAVDFLTSRRVKGCASATMSMYEQKLGHFERLWGGDLPLARIDAPRVDAFVATRLAEGAHRNTIGKELTTLRGLLKVAKRAGRFPRDLGEVLPIEWSNDYEPRRTTLTLEQVWRLVRYLAAPGTWTDSRGRTYKRTALWANRAAFVAFAIATGGRLSEVARARRGQVDLATGLVHFEITKTRKKGRREKFVPVTPLTRELLEYALATGGADVLFVPWSNVRRDLAAACADLGLPRVTPNDLRRTHANWLRAAGVDLGSIADVLGHVDSRMLEHVYGKLRPEQLKARILEQVH